MTELEIEAFLAIVRTGSISAAAQKLYVTQPALSRRIHALEQELGYSLMVRKKGVRSIELTSQGKAFISLAEKWKTVWNESRNVLCGTGTASWESAVLQSDENPVKNRRIKISKKY